MCFHIRALTVGMTKKGDTSSRRTMARPGNGSSIKSAMAMPMTVVMTITDPSSSRVLATELAKDGSVTK